MALVTTDRLNTYHKEGIEPLIEIVQGLCEAEASLEEAIQNIQSNPSGGGSESSGGSAVGGGVINAYIRPTGIQFEDTWLSADSPDVEDNPQPITPRSDVLYVILSEGLYFNNIFRWSENTSKYVAVSTVRTSSGDSESGGGSGISDVESIVSDAVNNALEVDESDGKLYVDGSILNRLGVNSLGHLTFEGSEIQGSGGSGSGVTFTLRNRDAWVSKQIVTGSNLELNLNWSCIENDLPTSDGTLVVKVNNVTKRTMTVQQGNVTLDITDYLVNGANTINIQISDVYGNNRKLILNVTVVSLTISSTFDPTLFYSDEILFSYTPFGSAEKVVHISLDGTEVETVETSVSNRQLTYTIDPLTYGAHTLEVYFSAVLDGEDVTSNVLEYEFISTYRSNSNDPPIIVTDVIPSSVKQYENMPIGFTVYTPSSLESSVSISVNDKVVSSQLVDRNRQTYVFRPTEIGATTIKITTGNVTKTLSLTVTSSGMNIEAVTDQLSLYLSSYGRNNNEVNKNLWVDEDNDVTCSLTGFNWVNNGWIIDAEGSVALRVSNGARVSIPYKMFGADFKRRGKTIELEFATRYITDTSDTIMSCMANNIGIEVTPQLITLYSEQSEIHYQFKEDEHVRIGFVVEKQAENRLIYCYVNGIRSAVIQYPTTDNFGQSSPADFVIGADSCTVDLYTIRVYDNSLSNQEMVENWIADTQDLNQMIYRYHHNDIYDDYGAISINKLPDDLPYLVLQAPSLPQYKGDKKPVDGYFVDPTGTRQNFSFTGAEANVQGTSSQYYARKNYKIKFKNGFVLEDDSVISKYAIDENVVATKTFTFKADVASSEGANNTVLVNLYEEMIPWKTSYQKDDPKMRTGIFGFPIVIFYDDGSGMDPQFLGRQKSFSS